MQRMSDSGSLTSAIKDAARNVFFNFLPPSTKKLLYYAYQLVMVIVGQIPEVNDEIVMNLSLNASLI